MQSILFLKLMSRSRLGERKSVGNIWLQQALSKPRCDVFSRVSLFIGGGFEHDETVDGTAFDVKRSHGKRGTSVASRHEDHAATVG